MRKSKSKEIVYQPRTIEILTCIEEVPEWCKLLYNRHKGYEVFLDYIFNQNQYDSEGRKTLKSIASDIQVTQNKLTKWIQEIYIDIFELNMNQPELFKDDGIKHEFTFKYYDSRAYFTIWLPQTPRMYDRFTFDLVKAKVGTDTFWVKDVEHKMEKGEYSVYINLEGGNRNIYRELLVDRALFTGVLHFMDTYNMKSFEIDEILLKWYKR